MGTTVKAKDRAKPRSTRAAYSWYTLLAVPASTQPTRNGAAADSSVNFLPTLCDKSVTPLGSVEKSYGIGLIVGG